MIYELCRAFSQIERIINRCFIFYLLLNVLIKKKIYIDYRKMNI